MVRNISIVIPFYEKHAALNQMFDDLVLQLHPDDEVIIVDDHSPSGPPEITCPCTEIIQPPKQEPHIYRLCTLRNYGIAHAKHDWVVILDPDCVPNPRFLDYMRKMIDPNVLFAGCIDKYREDGSVVKDPRRNNDHSYWLDIRDKGGAGVWGGVMAFSKSRTETLGWFDEGYNNGWGAEEHDFASKCYHSGMRLRYSMELQVTHLWHQKNTTGNERNVELWKQRRRIYADNLNMFTPYKPAVGVMIITMLRPELINQCLQAVYRNRVPLKTRLVNNGDNGEDTRRICHEWGNRWTVDYIHHERMPPAIVRNESLKWAKNNGYKYMVFIDDDVTVVNDGITKLVQVAENHPEYIAISGKLMMPNQKTRLLGGPLKGNIFNNYGDRRGIYESDWVGGGFTVHRLDPLILYDEEYQTGYNDYDWSMNAKSLGYRLGVTGDAVAWHGALFTSKGVEKHRNISEYNEIRYDKERHERMNDRFASKWGFHVKGGAKIVD